MTQVWNITTAFKLRHCAHATKSGSFSTSVEVLEQAAREIVLLEEEVLRCGGKLPDGYVPQEQNGLKPKPANNKP